MRHWRARTFQKRSSTIQRSNYWRERREAARDAEVADLRLNLDEAYRESVEEARHDPPPATVRAYDRFPAGWPPEGEGENSSYPQGGTEKALQPVRRRRSAIA